MTAIIETIGRCEGPCGLIDHHLVGGLCVNCRVVCVDTDIADEAANVNAVAGYVAGSKHPREDFPELYSPSKHAGVVPPTPGDFIKELHRLFPDFVAE